MSNNQNKIEEINKFTKMEFWIIACVSTFLFLIVAICIYYHANSKMNQADLQVEEYVQKIQEIQKETDEKIKNITRFVEDIREDDPEKFDKLRSQLDKATAEIEQLKSKVAKADKDYSNLHDAYKGTTTEIEQLKSEIAGANKDKSKLQSANNDLETSNQKLEKYVRQLNAFIDQYEKYVWNKLSGRPVRE
ncbi:MAG: hypothetical protein LBI18_12385 [Planctomycetaceae bacterium]|nr:hypothetical protein [Planctomycetaceae bacterium]